MARETSLRWLALGLAILLGLAGGFGPAGYAAAQTATTMIQLESPGGSSPSSTRLMINGWAADPTGRGSGVDIVRVYLGDPENGGQDLGQATYGQPRPDVARTLGDQRFTNSGFQLAVELPAGEHTVYIFAHLNTAGPDEGWASYSKTFTASTSVRPDPQAVALLNGDQPQIRTAAPPPAGTSGSTSGSRSGSSGFTATADSSGGIRTTPSRHDPIPLDPVVPGMSTAQSSGSGGAELADATGSGSGIRQSIVSEGATGGNAGSQQYRTGSVSMVGGGGNLCPGPNCPSNTGNMNSQLQQLPSHLIRELTGYNIPGLGNNTPCTPSSSPGGCNPTTGTSAAPGAPTGTQLLQQQATAALQTDRQPTMQAPTNQGPACAQMVGGQCLVQMGAQGPLGSTCLRFAGAQCVYYGQAQSQPGGAGQTAVNPTALLNPQAGAQGALAGLGAAGCAQWGSGGQCLTPAGGAASAAPRDGFIPGLATTYPAGVLSPVAGAGSVTAPSSLASTTAPTSLPSTTAALPPSVPGLSAAAAPAGYAGAPVAPPAAPASGGQCLQFSPSGACTQFR